MGAVSSTVTQTLRRGGWPLLGLSSAVLAALALSGKPKAKPEVAPPAFPRAPAPGARLRKLERQALPVEGSSAPRGAGQATQGPATAEPTPARIDPLHVALAGTASVLVLEAPALKETLLGQLLIRCLTPRGEESLRQLRRDLHFDPVELGDRVAIAEVSSGGPPLILLGGDFSSLRRADAGGPGTPTQELGRLLFQSRETVGLWADRLAILGEREDVLRVLDRLEGPDGPREPSPLAEEETYGQIYGTIGRTWMRRLLPRDLGEQAALALERATVHVSAAEDLWIVAEAYGPSNPAAELGVSLGSALARMRAEAISEGDKRLRRLLDNARVVRATGGFRLEVALPLATVEDQLSHCGERRPSPRGRHL